MSLTTKRIVLALLVAVFACGSIVLPASAKKGKTGAAKCKKKGKKAKKKRICPSGSGSGSNRGSSLPGQPTHPAPTPGTGSGSGSGGGTGGGGATQLSPTALSVTDNPVLGGTATQGQVTIGGTAPSGGQAVTLGSSDPSRASVPTSVVVAPGQSTANFTVNTTTGATATPTLTASVGSSSVNAQVTVVQFPSVTAVTLDHQCFPTTGLTNYGFNTVTLDVPAPANLPVNLSSSDTNSLTVPSTVTVPAGSKTGVFNVNTVAATPSVTVTASVNGSQKTSDPSSVRDSGSPTPVVTNVAVLPTTVTAGSGATGSVTLDCEALPGQPLTVTLSSDNPAVGVPATVVVPADSRTATFPITTTANAANTDAHISATPGSAPPATLTVTDLGT